MTPVDASRTTDHEAAELAAWQVATGSSSPDHAPWPAVRAQVGSCLLVLAGLLVAGLVVGWIWALTAPEVVATASGGGFADPEFQIGRFFQGEGLFAALAVVAGLVSGFATRWRIREDGASVAVVLAIGGVLASVVAWRLGVWLGPDHIDAASVSDGTLVTQPLRLRSPGILVLWPLAAMFVALWVSVLGPDERPSRKLPNSPS